MLKCGAAHARSLYSAVGMCKATSTSYQHVSRHAPQLDSSATRCQDTAQFELVPAPPPDGVAAAARRAQWSAWRTSATGS
eukprot:356701-Chlamydomonas_euryale.AAC.9